MNHPPRENERISRLLELEFYTAKQLAVILQLHPRTIYRMAKNGELICHKFRRCKRFRRQEIEDFIESSIGVR
jgi:excisionase family DNA binding protein